ncbi:serine-threonine protein kinase [Streptomyces sp. NPDC006326]|uniref:serine-threonine protein kinase n=1 Tax=Streptomyces sp. NPDC006326 TaxID=3156752 RepID=UPI0033B229E4
MSDGTVAGDGSGAGGGPGSGRGSGPGNGRAGGGGPGAAVAAGIGVRPYAELTFDSEGDVDRATREAVAAMDATDLLVFAHGWNSDRATSTRLFDRFYAPFPRLVGPGTRLGYVGVVWPSIRFSDEPIPDFELPAEAAGNTPAPGLDTETRRALGAFWPGREEELDRIAGLLRERPRSTAALVEFGALVREVAGVAVADGAAGAVPSAEVPAIFTRDVLEVCRVFADALARAGAPAAVGSPADGAGVQAPSPGADDPQSLWNGARELLRQATYYQMKRRAGVVGEHGLGPVLADLAGRRPGLRVHLIGHSFGARVVSFALRAVPDGSRYVKSVTLLQGAFSHYAFADRLPHAGNGGALRGMQRRVDGPVVACHSPHDTALAVFYPLASRMAGDSAGLLGFDERWGAIGHDGVQAVPGAARLTLDAALREGLPAAGCVSVDAGSVVRRGGPPSGAHSDVCHEELARVVVAAGRVGR